MRHAAALASTAILASGCATHAAAMQATKAGGIMMLAGVGLAVLGVGESATHLDQPGSNSGGGALFALGGITLLGGVVLGLAGLAGLSNTSTAARAAEIEDASPDTGWSRPPAPPRATDPALSHLADLAWAAAAIGDCRSALALATRIEQRDRTYHTAVIAAGALGSCR
jgi:hypothetical protein